VPRWFVVTRKSRFVAGPLPMALGCRVRMKSAAGMGGAFVCGRGAAGGGKRREIKQQMQRAIAHRGAEKGAGG